MLALKVLLLEDEPLISVHIETVLEAEGFEVSLAMSCVEASSWLDRCRPDIVVVDIGLRDGTCTQVAARLLEAGIPFVVYTGEHRSFYANTPFSQGIWVEKPAAPEELVQAVNEVLASQVKLSRYA